MVTSRTIVGVDVGGTNTDAVLLDLDLARSSPQDSILATHKTPTTSDPTTGIVSAVKAVTAIATVSQRARESIVAVNIGTTQFINAVVQRDASKLASVAVLRLCGPYTREVPPFEGFPPHLRRILEGYIAYLPGGLEIDGRVISDVDASAVRRAANAIKTAGIKDIAVIGTYAPIDLVHRQEEKVGDMLASLLGPQVNITLSHTVAGIGYLERENATILNAAILPLAKRTVAAFVSALAPLNLGAPVFLTQNDGTIIAAEEAAKLPIRTFLSGPINSLTGAGFLAGLGESAVTDVMVLDIGGTTSDVCVLEKSGFPRPAATFSTFAGVRTNFAVPDVQSIGLGGGSLVRVVEDGTVQVGPTSVGKDLTTRSRVFGGPELTVTDIIVAAGLEEIGQPALVQQVPAPVVLQSQALVKTMLEALIDEMKTSPTDVPVVLVGGGNIVCPETLRGVSEVIKPRHSTVANAIGAAMARVSGVIDTIVTLSGPKTKEDALIEIRREAVRKAEKSGAENPQIVEESVIPVAYVNTKSYRIIVRAVGVLSGELLASRGRRLSLDQAFSEEEAEAKPQKVHGQIPSNPVPEEIDIRDYRPAVEDGHWTLSITDLDFIAAGCGILGCGGGGDTHASYLSVRHKLMSGASVSVVDPETLADDGFLPAVAFMGSPSTFSERIPSGDELKASVDAVLAARGADSSDLTAVMSLEIGGSNGLRGIQGAMWTGKPVVDADLMGRAYPNLWQVTPNNADISLAPTAASDAKGNTVVQVHSHSNRDLEDLLRAVCVYMGQAAGISLGALNGHQVKQYASQRSISLAWYLGRALRLARLQKQDLVQGILAVYPGKLLLTGKITHVVRDAVAGFTEGSVEIVALAGTQSPAPPSPRRLKITFQNENIHAFDPESQSSLATVPDLISVLDAEDGEALGTQDYRYGLRVHVIALVGSPNWTTAKGLQNGGPQAFGLDVPYTPIAQFRQPLSVIKEFGVLP